MKRLIYIIALLAATGLQAQTLYVNNGDGTYLPIETAETKDITFNETSKVVTLTLDGGIKHCFHTGKLESISPKTSNSDILFFTEPFVAFDPNDRNSFNEVVETIPNEETEDNDYGDYVEKYSVNKIINITFSENDVTVSGDIPYTKNGAHLTINSTSSKVRYVLTGKSSNGSFKIYSEKKFQIMVSELELTNPAGPAINIQTGKTVYFTIKGNTVNSLCDGAVYSAPVVGTDGEEEDQKGTLFSEGQLIFNGNENGTGVLNITSLGGHGICSDDYIRVRSGNINIVGAAKDGFHTNDKFIVGRTAAASPKITVNATNDGIDCGKGEVIINAGVIELNTEGEAIKVEYEEATPDPAVTPNATINGGYIKFTTTGSKSSGIKTTGTFKQTGGVIHGTVKGDGSKIVNCDSSITINGGKLVGVAEGTAFNETTSAGGIKCEDDMTVQGCTIAIECTGKGAKGINSKNMTVKSGEITVLSIGENYKGTIESRKSKAIETGNLTMTNGYINLRGYENAISANKVAIYKGTLHAISDKATAIDATITQSAGWLMIKENE